MSNWLRDIDSFSELLDKLSDRKYVGLILFSSKQKMLDFLVDYKKFFKGQLKGYYLIKLDAYSFKSGALLKFASVENPDELRIILRSYFSEVEYDNQISTRVKEVIEARLRKQIANGRVCKIK